MYVKHNLQLTGNLFRCSLEFLLLTPQGDFILHFPA